MIDIILEVCTYITVYKICFNYLLITKLNILKGKSPFLKKKKNYIY